MHLKFPNYQHSDNGKNSNTNDLDINNKQNYLTENQNEKKIEEQAHKSQLLQALSKTKYLDSTFSELNNIRRSKRNDIHIKLSEKNKLEESRIINSYNYRYQILHPSRIDTDNKNRLNCNTNNKNSFLQIKLKDLIDINRENIFIDNLYAQFKSDSNIVNLVYVSPMDRVPENSVLLNNGFVKMLKN